MEGEQHPAKSSQAGEPTLSVFDKKSIGAGLGLLAILLFALASASAVSFDSEWGITAVIFILGGGCLAGTLWMIRGTVKKSAQSVITLAVISSSILAGFVLGRLGNSSISRTASAFRGRLVVQLDDKVVQITKDPVKPRFIVSVLVGDVAIPKPFRPVRVAVSPDEHYLLYSTQGGIRLRDLGTVAERTLISRSAVSLSWSPDNLRFSFVVPGAQPDDCSTEELFVSDLSGRFYSVCRSQEATYYNPDSTQSVTYCSELECGVWLKPDEFVFRRRTKAMPRSVHFNGPYAQFDGRADTLTTARIAASSPDGYTRLVRLEDSEDRFLPNTHDLYYIKDGRYIFFIDRDSHQERLAVDLGSAYDNKSPESIVDTEGKYMAIEVKGDISLVDLNERGGGLLGHIKHLDADKALRFVAWLH
jgi:hypothetical protein